MVDLYAKWTDHFAFCKLNSPLFVSICGIQVYRFTGLISMPSMRTQCSFDVVDTTLKQRHVFIVYSHLLRVFWFSQTLCMFVSRVSIIKYENSIQPSSKTQYTKTTTFSTLDVPTTFLRWSNLNPNAEPEYMIISFCLLKCYSYLL